MKDRWRSIAASLVALGALGQAPSGGGPPPPPVEVAPVVREKVSDSVRLVGDLEARRLSTVAASIDGLVEEFTAEEGRWVKKGEILARLQDDLLRVEIESATAARDEARARHQKARADLVRAETLISRDAVTPKELDAFRADAEITRLQAAQSEAGVRRLEIELEKKTVKAPFDGQVVSEMSEVGQWLARGGPVARVAHLEEVYVRIQAPERYVGRVEPGGSRPVEVTALPGRPFEGTVVSVGSLGDPAARTFPVRLRVPNPDRILRAGMSAEVEFRFERREPVLLVPKDAVLLQGQRGIVYAVRGGRARMVPVAVGSPYGDRLEVQGELQEGEMVVSRGNERLQPGMPVRIVKATNGPPADQGTPGGAPRKDSAP